MAFQQNLVLFQLHFPDDSQMLVLLLVECCSQTFHLNAQDLMHGQTQLTKLLNAVEDTKSQFCTQIYLVRMRDL